MPHSSSHVHESLGICMAAGAARGLTVEVGAAGGTAVRAATAEAPSEARSM